MLPEEMIVRCPNHRLALAVSGVLVGLLGAFLLTGCQLLASPSAATPMSGLPSATPALPSASPTRPNPTATAFDPSAPMTLTLWLPVEMASGDAKIEKAMSDLTRFFANANPQVTVVVTPKALSGVGGMVSRLSTTKPVAPEQLPDLVAFDLAELPRLASEGLLIPQDDLLPVGAWDVLYPFALDAVSVGERKLAMPFHADILYLAYNNTMVTTPPFTWGGLQAARATLLFPASAGDGSAADVFFLQYMARGGNLKGLEGSYLDVNIATDVLRDYRAAMDSGVLLPLVRDLHTLEECWSVYLQGEAGMTVVSSHQYLRDRAKLQRTRYAQIPTADGYPFTIARTWGWGIITQDPVRQAVAADYIAASLRHEWLASWSKASSYLPTQRTALEGAVDDKDYRLFLGRQLESALAYPSAPQYAPMQDIIIEAIGDVLDGVATPERAAASAAAAIARLR